MATAFYAVKDGHTPGIYTSWDECKRQVDGFPKAIYKKFKNPKDAEAFMMPEAPSEPISEKRMPLVALSEQQQAVVDNVLEGKNVLLTGPAGTGKTTTIREMCNAVQARSWSYGVTAMTGCAAVLIQGRTLHSFLGIGLASKRAEVLATITKTKKPLVYERLLTLKLLIIDEISMMNAELFAKVSKYLSDIRMNDKPFGGIQVVLCGDFAQLPPVEGEFCFQASEWQQLDIQKHMLTKLFRQGADTEFQDMLSRLRQGVCNDKDLVRLQKCMCTEFPDGIKPTKLYPLNRDVDRINRDEYQALKSTGMRTMTYKTSFKLGGKSDMCVKDLKMFAEKSGIPEMVEVCMGAQVIVVWNINETIVNGTRGYVVDLHPNYVDIQTVSDGKVRVPMTEVPFAESNQDKVVFMPLKLGYALSIHKSQGMTVDAVEMDLGMDIFEYGQAYVALSRAKSLKSVRIVDVHPRSFRTHPKVLEFYQ